MTILWVPPSSGLSAVAEAFSEKEEWDLIQPPTADVKLRVPWSQRHLVVSAVAGMQWPYLSSVPLYCVHAGVSTIPNTRCLNDGYGNQYAEAFVDLHFDPFSTFTESIKTNGEMLKVPRVGTLFNSSGDTQFMLLAWKEESEAVLPYTSVTPEEAPSKIITGIDYEVAFEELDLIPDEVLTLVDCCNADPVTTINLGLTFEAETLILLSSDAKHTVNIDGSVKNSLNLKFGWRKNGWNRYWRATTQSWEYQYVIPIAATDLPVPDHPASFDADPDGPAPVIYRNFPTADFTALLPAA
jgi:hypothetical protein